MKVAKTLNRSRLYIAGREVDSCFGIGSFVDLCCVTSSASGFSCSQGDLRGSCVVA